MVTRSGKPEKDAPPTPADVRRRAIDLLARREHSVRELRRKLTTRGFETAMVDEAIGELTAEGLQSDARTAEELSASHVRKGKGPLRIRLDLERRGVAGELIEQALDECDADWAALACTVRNKRFGSPLPEEFRERARQARFLQSRGFTTDQIRTALGD